MFAVLKGVLLKFLNSALKGGLSAVLVALTAAAGAIPAVEDKAAALVVAGFTALLHAVISAIKRAMEFDPSKVIK